MPILCKILTAMLAIEHLYFLYVEMFRWTAPRTRKAFGTTEEFAQASKILAANQGLYNGFLAAGLIWAIVAVGDMAKPLTLFFAGCVLVAGLYGGMTANKKILVLQALPGAATLLLAFLSN
jgi:putative membrane protein